jgi:hypothetical protein
MEAGRYGARSSLGRWLDAKGRGVDGERTQSLGAEVGADLAGDGDTTYVRSNGLERSGHV